MKYSLNLLTLFCIAILSAQAQNSDIDNRQYSNITDLHPTDSLFMVYNGNKYELGVPCGYISQEGDTIIPIGSYQYCFFDTVTTYAIVGDSSGFFAIDQKSNRLFDVYWFDNGPDDVIEGLFRMRRNGKIGYANTKGEVVIDPIYDCANSFENGKAKVTMDCTLDKVEDHFIMNSKTWFYIDKTGKKTEE